MSRVLSRDGKPASVVGEVKFSCRGSQVQCLRAVYVDSRVKTADHCLALLPSPLEPPYSSSDSPLEAVSSPPTEVIFVM